MKKINDFFWNLIYYIKNIIKWSPILWNDRDWDYKYIYDTLSFKIKCTSKYTEKRNTFVSCEEKVREMNICVKLIDRINSKYYEDEYFNYFDIKMNFKEIPNDDKYKEIDFETIRDDLNSYFHKYPNSYKRAIFKSSNKQQTAMIMGFERHEKAKRLLYKLLSKNLEGWWD